MALDDDAKAALAKMLASPACLDDLQKIADKRKLENLKNFLKNTDADRLDYDEIIEEARKTVLGKGGQSAGSKSSQKATGKRPSAKDTPLAALSQPYRFIDLPDKVVGPEKDQPILLDEPLEDGFCATITVDWIAESPLLIGGPTKGKKSGAEQANVVRPLKIGNRYVLPGATLKGLTRSITEIVAYAKLTQGNMHYRFGLRDFLHPYYAEGAGVSKVENVRAGFLTIRDAVETRKSEDGTTIEGDPSDTVVVTKKTKRVWEITPVSNWGHVRIGSLENAGVPSHLMTTENKNGEERHKAWFEQTLEKKYTALGMMKDGKIDFSVLKSFSLGQDDHGKKVYNADKNGGAKGIMVVAGKLPGGGNKKYEYFVAPPAKDARRFAIKKDIAELFARLHSDPGKGDDLSPVGNWKTLEPIARKTGIPVFFIGDPSSENSGFFFGLTRLFKVPHKLSVGDLLKLTQPEHAMRAISHKQDNVAVMDGYANVDFVENLFGYVVEPRDFGLDNGVSVAPGASALKGRVSFGFAHLNDPANPRESEPVDLIQMAPRASYAPFYLKGEIKDYSGGGPKNDTRLAGRKAYFPRYTTPDFKKSIADFKGFGAKQIEDVKATSSNGKAPTEDVMSHLSFLVPSGNEPLEFTGDIHFHNVTAAELGAVLYALTHGGDHEKRFRHLIGRGKPIGAGQMRMGRVSLKVEANSGKDTRVQTPRPEEIYDPKTGKGFAEPDAKSLEPFLKAFEDYMRSKIGGTYPMQSSAICEWLGMSDPAEGANLHAANRLSYKPMEQIQEKGQAKSISAFQAYGNLRKLTQSMNTSDPGDRPPDIPKLLKTPQKQPKKR